MLQKTISTTITADAMLKSVVRMAITIFTTRADDINGRVNNNESIAIVVHKCLL